METLTAQVVRLEREKTAACKQTEEERKRTHAEKLRADAGDWTNLAFRCDKAQHVKRMKVWEVCHLYIYIYIYIYIYYHMISLHFLLTVYLSGSSPGW